MSTALALLALRFRSLYPFVLAALCETPPNQRSGIKVLDIPAGRGGLSFALAAAGFQVTPADLFPEYLHDHQRDLTLRSARALIQEMSHLRSLPRWLAEMIFGGDGDAPVDPNLRCQRADLEGSIQAPASSFDYVVCVEGIEHVADRHHTLREFRRVLKPGGAIASHDSESDVAARPVGLHPRGAAGPKILHR
jgi:SAM-dependent methyltransferase